TSILNSGVTAVHVTMTAIYLKAGCLSGTSTEQTVTAPSFTSYMTV
ncbi:unnamed protein product, partial [marine sediment metagenome]